MAAPAAKLQRRTLAEQISDALIDAIMDGSVKMGDKLRTQDLADQFGVSRMPVREALISLQANGLVDATPYSGYRVAALDRTRIREIYIIRRALEPIVAREAAARIDEEGLALLERELAALEESALGSEPTARDIYLRNREFHFSLYELANMPQTVEIIRTAWDRIAVYKLLYSQKYIADHEAAEQMVAGHHEILGALRDRRPDELARLLTEDIARHEQAVPDEFNHVEAS
ncbi:MAG TPA: GntR family transcriptional regulator [Cellulomonas sp.]